MKPSTSEAEAEQNWHQALRHPVPVVPKVSPFTRFFFLCRVFGILLTVLVLAGFRGGLITLDLTKLYKNSYDMTG